MKECTCSSSSITRYQKRISGPLLDRIDIHLDVPRIEYEKLADRRSGEASSVIRERVEQARTIADLAGDAAIRSHHLAEALQYRPRVVA